MGLRTYLAGYNIDAETITELKNKANWENDNLTPETLSAAYARISRDPRPINELRAESRTEVAKSRKSNQTIIFGLGHASVAEHAYFNFDVIGLSRLAVEDVQKFRLASFTEKSQRYITLNGDYVVPEEIKALGEEYLNEYQEIIKLQNSTYQILYDKLKEYQFAKNADFVKSKRGAMTVDGWAKEDARYILSMATESQFGMSVNARTLENMLKRFFASDLAEVRELGRQIYEKVHKLSPSIIKYVEPSEYDLYTEKNLKDLVSGIFSDYQRNDNQDNNTKLISADSADYFFTLTIAKSLNISENEARLLAKKLTDNQKKEILRTLLTDRKFYDSVLPLFEQINFKYDTVISSSNYAQFKRHRLSSQEVFEYDPLHGVVVPEAVKKVNEEQLFNDVIRRTNDFYHKLLDKVEPKIAAYILTNSHKRRIIFNMNLRELYHFFSLRIDEHAQWDIKNTAKEMLTEVKKSAPLLSVMCCGKHEYEEQLSKCFS